MSPAAQDDIGPGTYTSDTGGLRSPLHRKFSETMHPSISPQSQSPTLMAQETKCAWCGKYIEIPDDEDEYSHSQALKEHIAMVHPHIAKFSMYDGAADEEPEDGLSHSSDDQQEDAAVQEGGEDDALEDGDDAEDDTGDVEAEDALDEGDPDTENVEAEGDADVHEEEPDQLHGFSHEQDAASVDKRLHGFWNIHDPREFSEDFDDEMADVENTWDYAFNETKRSRKRVPSEVSDRPGPYRKQKASKGEFLQITSLDEFLTQLRDPESRSTDELYAITQNAALALKTWQDEYTAIDKLYKRATRYALKPTANPRKPEAKEVFEDKKEACLYGYKYDPKPDKVGKQNPFLQGHFKPNSTQMRKIITKTGPNNPNPDDWRPIQKFGVEYIPKLQDAPRKAPLPPKTTRKRRAAEIEALTMGEDTEDAQSETPATEEYPAKRRTRARVNAAEGAPPARGTTRGRGRGRGASRMSSRGSEPIAPPSPSDTPVPAGPAPVTVDSQPAAATAPVAAESRGGAPDAAEEARRLKIANSKNPKRTEAMLNHWARFNREGRVRNPKRTKAQIEADRVADAAKRVAEAPKPAARRPSAVPAPHFGPVPHMQPTQMPPLAARGPIAQLPQIDPRAVPHPFGPTPGQQLQQPMPQIPYHSPYTEYYMHPYGPPPPHYPGPPRPA